MRVNEFNIQLCATNSGKMTLQFKQYTKNLSKPNEENHFLLPWGGVVLRNCDDLGDLLTFKSVAHYREEGKPLWLVLALVLFRENVRKSFQIIKLHINFIFVVAGGIFPNLFM